MPHHVHLSYYKISAVLVKQTLFRYVRQLTTATVQYSMFGELSLWWEWRYRDSDRSAQLYGACVSCVAHVRQPQS